jgi:hypothetical protein
MKWGNRTQLRGMDASTEATRPFWKLLAWYAARKGKGLFVSAIPPGAAQRAHFRGIRRARFARGNDPELVIEHPLGGML